MIIVSLFWFFIFLIRRRFVSNSGIVETTSLTPDKLKSLKLAYQATLDGYSSGVSTPVQRRGSLIPSNISKQKRASSNLQTQ